MKVTKVTKFQTSDKHLFEVEGDAKRHESSLIAVEDLKKLLNISIKTGRIESVLQQLVEEAIPVQALLWDYRKRLPVEMRKVKKDQAAEAAA